MTRSRGYAVTLALLLGLVFAGSGRPALGQAPPAARKLDIAHIVPPPESSAVGFKWMAEELTRRSNGSLYVVFHGGTLLSKELEIMDAVKSGNIAMGGPAGAACTVFPEMCVFQKPCHVRGHGNGDAVGTG